MVSWIVENTIIAAVLAALATLMFHYVRVRPAVRHIVWLVILFKLLTPSWLLWNWRIPVRFATAATVQQQDLPTETDSPQSNPQREHAGNLPETLKPDPDADLPPNTVANTTSAPDGVATAKTSTVVTGNETPPTLADGTPPIVADAVSTSVRETVPSNTPNAVPIFNNDEFDAPVANLQTSTATQQFVDPEPASMATPNEEFAAAPDVVEMPVPSPAEAGLDWETPPRAKPKESVPTTPINVESPAAGQDRTESSDAKLSSTESPVSKNHSQPSRENRAVEDMAEKETPASTDPTSKTIGNTSSKSADLLRTVAWIGWLIGCLVVLGVQSRRILRVCSCLRDVVVVPEWLDVLVKEIADELRVRAPGVSLISGVPTPCVWAWGKPRLLWPAELHADKPEMVDAWRGVVIHELAHLRRRDHWVGWLELLASCLWWWNPVFWYVRRQLRFNAELACDAWVTELNPEGRRAYAEALLAVCELTSHSQRPMAALGVGNEASRILKRRLTMILRERVKSRLSWTGLLAALVLALLVIPGWSQKTAQHFLKPQPTTFQDFPMATQSGRAQVVTVAAPAGQAVVSSGRTPASADPFADTHQAVSPSPFFEAPPSTENDPFGEPVFAQASPGFDAPENTGFGSSQDAFISGPPVAKTPTDGGFEEALASAPAFDEFSHPPSQPESVQKKATLQELQMQLQNLAKQITAMQQAGPVKYQPLDPVPSATAQKPTTRRPVTIYRPHQTVLEAESLPLSLPPQPLPPQTIAPYVVKTETFTLCRTTYKLPKGKAESLQTFLTQNVIGGEVSQILVKPMEDDQDLITITTTPEAQQAIGRLIALMQQFNGPQGSTGRTFLAPTPDPVNPNAPPTPFTRSSPPVRPQQLVPATSKVPMYADPVQKPSNEFQPASPAKPASTAPAAPKPQPLSPIEEPGFGSNS